MVDVMTKLLSNEIVLTIRNKLQWYQEYDIDAHIYIYTCKYDRGYYELDTSCSFYYQYNFE